MDAADLNQLVDSGSALGGIIFDQPVKAHPISTDGLLLYDSEVLGGDLKKTTISQLPVVLSATMVMPTSEFTVTNNTVAGATTMTAAWKPQPGNKFFAGNGPGVGTTPTFRPILAEDIAIAPSEIFGSTIDWALGNVFHKYLTTPGMFTFLNLQDGQTIKVLMGQDSVGSRWVSFPNTIWWEDWRKDGGVGSRLPVQYGSPFCVDIYEFTCYAGTVFGKANTNYAIVP